MAPLVPSFVRDATGREAAFERLYKRYAGDVYRYSLALLRNPADAEDATQTTFMNAYRAIQRGEEPRKPQNWLITIAHNACRKRFAYASRRVKEVPLDESLASLPVPESERPNIEGVLDALGLLPFNQRAALVMRELEGRSYTEIAETLGISRSAVEALLFRARRSLKVRATSLRSLTLVQLPGSLARFFEDPTALVGGGTAAAGGAGLLAKLAIVLAVGAVAGGTAVIAHPPAARSAAGVSDAGAVPLTRPAARVFSLAPLRRDARRFAAQPAATRTKAKSVASAPRSISTGERLSDSGATADHAVAADTASAPAAAPTDAVTSTVASAPVHLPVSAPSVPVSAPSLPVSAPSLPVSTPSLPVSTPTVTLPKLP